MKWCLLQWQGLYYRSIKNVGDAVKKGDVLVILEAMKMENDIVAPKDGKVVAVNVKRETA